MRNRSASILMGFIHAMSNRYMDSTRKYATNRPKRSAEFIEESKALAEQKRQRRCERNLKLVESGGFKCLK